MREKDYCYGFFLDSNGCSGYSRKSAKLHEIASCRSVCVCESVCVYVCVGVCVARKSVMRVCVCVCVCVCV